MKETRSVCNTIADEGFPHVVISERFDEPNVCSIDCDSKPDSIRAVEYLIGLGHERIAFGVHNVSDLDHLDRYYGYVEALERNGIEVDEGLIFRQPFTIAGGAAIMQLQINETFPVKSAQDVHILDWKIAHGNQSRESGASRANIQTQSP